jgi:hypothetical protein
MSARASIRQADLDRALKAAAKNGLRVVVEGTQIHFLPMSGDTGLSSATPPFDVQKALAAWRRSA